MVFTAEGLAPLPPGRTYQLWVISGGAPCPQPVFERFWERGLEFKTGYGLTEAGPGGLYLAEEYALTKLGSIGKPNMFIDATLLDDDGSERRVPIEAVREGGSRPEVVVLTSDPAMAVLAFALLRGLRFDRINAAAVAELLPWAAKAMPWSIARRSSASAFSSTGPAGITPL